MTKIRATRKSARALVGKDAFPFKRARLPQAMSLCFAISSGATILPATVQAKCPNDAAALTITGDTISGSTIIWGTLPSISGACTVTDSGNLDVTGALPPDATSILSTGSLTLTNYGRLNIGGSFTSSATGQTFTAYATLTNSGELVNQHYSGGIYIDSAALYNKGDLQSDGNIYNKVHGTFTNDKTATLSSKSHLSNAGYLRNNDQLSNAGTINNSTKTGNGIIKNFGDLTNSGILNNNNFLSNKSSLTNSGTLHNLSLGTLRNYGTLTSSGAITNDAGGALTNYGTLSSSGTITNHGSLHNLYVLDIGSAGTFYNDTFSGTHAASFVNSDTVRNHGNFVNYKSANNSGIFNNYGNFSNFGTVSTYFSFRNSGSLTNNGTLTVASPGGSPSVLLNTPDGVLSNHGTLNDKKTLVNGGTLKNASTGTLNNSAELDNGGQVLAPDAQSLLTYTGVLENRGTLNNAGVLNNTVGSTLTNYGTINSSGTLNNAGAVTLKAGSSLANSGTLTNSGSLLVTNDTYGDLSLTNTGTLNNSGLMKLYGSMPLAGSGGTLNNRAGGRIYSYTYVTFNAGDTGTVNLAAGGLFKNEGSFLVGSARTQANAGTLLNLGTLTNAGTLNNTGVISNAVTAAGAGFITLAQGSTLNNQAGGVIGNFTTLINQGTLNNGGTLVNDQALVESFGFLPSTGVLSNQGLLRNLAGGTFVNKGSFENDRSGVLDSLGSVKNQAGASLTNAGSIDIRTDALANKADSSLLNLGTLTNNHHITIYAWAGYNSVLSNGGTFTNNGYLVNAGTLENGTTVSGVQFHGTLTNYGTISSSEALINRAGSTLVNQGALYNRPGGTVSNLGTLTNASYVRNDGGFNNFGQTTLLAGSMLVGDGVVYQQDGELRVDGTLAQSHVFVSGGVLKGTGTVSAQVTLSDTGVIAPGDSPGTLVIDGPFTMKGGTLEIQVDGTAAGQFDVLQITGLASFTGGRIEFDFSHAHDIAPTAAFEFLTARRGISGLDTLPVSFIGLVPGFTFDFAAGGSTATISFGNLHLAPAVSGGSLGAVPLPPALWLLGLPLAGILRRRVPIPV